jgi:predicted polyphosphate/ATP-dependent NAD kinase
MERGPLIVGFTEIAQGNSPLVGIIANPVSARDIRRVVANASSLQIADRANIVLRVLACLRACGIGDVVMMPENGGIGRHVDRGLARARNLGEQRFPNVHYLPMRVGGTVDDTHHATKALVSAGAAAIVVLGGDGTHRAVVAHCGATPIAGISTGTNNAFPTTASRPSRDSRSASPSPAGSPTRSLSSTTSASTSRSTNESWALSS